MAGGGEAEEDLVEALEDEWREVRLAAAEGLGRVGTVRSVAALHDAAEAAGRDRELRRRAAAAVAAIQARAPAAGRGQLSVAAAGGGELAMAGEDRGRVSLVDEM